MKPLHMRFAKIITLLLFVNFSATIVVAQFSLFKNGDRVCFIGNSITMNGRYYKYIELFYATRYPESKISFFNCGISGDDAGGILKRIDTDVFAHQPTWAILMIGMNDVRRSLYQKARQNEPGIREKQEQALQTYYTYVDSIVRLLIKSGSKVVLQTPSIYDQTSLFEAENNFGVNDALKKCAGFLKSLSQKYHLPVVDYWDVLNRVNEIVHKKDMQATIIGRDRVHPGVEGHFIMASEFLKMQNAPKYVSELTINVRRQRIVRMQNCTVSNIKYKKGEISFQSLEASLPYPLLSPDFKPDSLIRFTDQFNNEILQVESLKKGNYDVWVDSARIGNYAEKELSAGINLSLSRKLPQYIHAVKVLEQLESYRNIVTRLRQIKYVEYQFLDGDSLPDFDAGKARKLFDKILGRYGGEEAMYVNYYKRNFDEYLINKPLEKELQQNAASAFDKLYKINKPVNHHYSIIRKIKESAGRE